MRKTNTKSLLELLARIRTIKALDRAAKIDSYYRTTLKEQNMAYSELEKAGLDRKQKRIDVSSIKCFLQNTFYC